MLSMLLKKSKEVSYLLFILAMFVSNTYVLAIPVQVIQSKEGVITQGYDGVSHKGVDLVKDGYMLDYVIAHSSGHVIEVISDCNANTPDDSTNPGNMVKIDHGNGYVTRYLHLAYGSVTVQVGDFVEKGQVLGYMGNTGNSFGGHLHFEVYQNGERIDASEYLNKDFTEEEPVEDTINDALKLVKKSILKISSPKVYYQVKTKNYGWLAEVRNSNDYAGYNNDAITDVAIGVTEGYVRYRVHVQNKGWLPYVTGYDINDYINGYAGNGQVIDAIEAYYYTPSNKEVKRIKYSVNDYPYQYDNEIGDGMDGYAGAMGIPITKLVMTLE